MSFGRIVICMFFCLFFTSQTRRSFPACPHETRTQEKETLREPRPRRDEYARYTRRQRPFSSENASGVGPRRRLCTTSYERTARGGPKINSTCARGGNVGGDKSTIVSEPVDATRGGGPSSPPAVVAVAGRARAARNTRADHIVYVYTNVREHVYR